MPSITPGRILAAAAVALALPLAPSDARSQPAARVPHVAVLAATDAAFAAPYIASGREGLRELGYVEGRNIVLEFRFGRGNPRPLSDLAAELVGLRPDLLVAVGDRAVDAAKHATTSIPIVMVAAGDPVRSGFVTSLARPGGNITGLSSLLPEMDAKLLALLKEAVPKISRAAVLWNPQSHGGILGYQAMQAAAPALGIELKSIETRTPGEVEQAFASMASARAGGFVVLTDPLTFSQRPRIIGLAVQHHMAAMFEVREFVDDGGLISYGPSLRTMMRRATTFVDRILKGARPAEMPIEQPTKFELVINLKTARALGLTVPQSLLLRADSVIE